MELLRLFGLGSLLGLGMFIPVGLLLWLLRPKPVETPLQVVQKTKFVRVAPVARATPLQFAFCEQSAPPAQPAGPDRSSVVAALRKLGCRRDEAEALAATIPADIVDDAACIEFVMRRG